MPVFRFPQKDREGYVVVLLEELTREIFESIGSGESAVNRDLGWPVIQVQPR